MPCSSRILSEMLPDIVTRENVIFFSNLLIYFIHKYFIICFKIIFAIILKWSSLVLQCIDAVMHTKYEDGIANNGDSGPKVIKLFSCSIQLNMKF